MKKLLTGNEAIARGAYESGVRVAVAYPGTPSTEILENVAQYREIYSEWAPNEKVALEVGIGASLAGARVLCAMKHVGVNVAADPLMTFSYTGVNGGLVLVSADDPGMHSSQNEQDNRIFAQFAKIALLEPSDSQEAKDFVGLGLEISERCDTPVMLRTTTRISHSKSLVEEAERTPLALRPYVKDIPKYVMTPAGARARHVVVEQRRAALAEFAETTGVNRVEWNTEEIGVITSGVVYQYAREALGDRVSYLKLGFTHPLPQKMIRDFAARVKKLYVIEELEPYLETQIKAWGIACHGKDLFPRIGEISADLIAEKVLGVSKEVPEPEKLPVRPPVMCPGCPHRGAFYVLKKLNLPVTGDIGCYALGAAPPLSATDSTVCMGASISMAHGWMKAIEGERPDRVVAVIGDSTFFHSGITSLLDIAYNRSNAITMILDNRITAMTGHQHHPGTGRTLMGEERPEIDLVGVVKALGIDRVSIVDPYDLKATEAALKEAIAYDGPSVIITRRPCALIEKTQPVKYLVKADKCKTCRICLRLGCPALEYDGETVQINPLTCYSCGICIDLCPTKAIVREEGEL